jgi:hypothetical protein
MNLRLHVKFLDALSLLSSVEQKRVRSVVVQLTGGEPTPGLRQHKVGDFTSFSAGMDIRILSVEETGGRTLVHVDHHDDAYRWGERHSAILDSGDVLLAVVPATTGVARASTKSESAAPVTNRFAALPSPVASVLNSARTDQELLDVIAALSPEWQELALAVASSSSELNPPSDIVAVDDELLQFALALPAEKWRVFLHPNQRAIVDLPPTSHLLIRGGPGTGKTVCIVHRFVRFAQQQLDRPPRLLALNPPAREALELACSSLGYVVPEGAIVEFDEIDKRVGFPDLLDQSSAVFIDEGQDLPVGVIARLLERLESGAVLPHITIAFDPNQAIVEPAGDALARLSPYSDSLSLTYCYRMTDEIRAYSKSVLDRLHDNYVGKRFQDQHHIDARRDAIGGQMVSGATGPEVEEVLVKEGDLAAIARITALKMLQDAGSWDGIGVILVGERSRALDDLERDGIPIASPGSVKGLEFLRGLVIDNLPHRSNENGKVVVTAAGYRELSGLYVAVTRFRDKVTVVRVAGPKRG